MPVRDLLPSRKTEETERRDLDAKRVTDVLVNRHREYLQDIRREQLERVVAHLISRYQGIHSGQAGDWGEKDRNIVNKNTSIPAEELEEEEDVDQSRINLNEDYDAFDAHRDIFDTLDMNKLSDDELNKYKDEMSIDFERNRVKPDDDNFVYDLKVDFGAVEEPNDWDSDENSAVSSHKNQTDDLSKDELRRDTAPRSSVGETSESGAKPSSALASNGDHQEAQEKDEPNDKPDIFSIPAFLRPATKVAPLSLPPLKNAPVQTKEEHKKEQQETKPKEEESSEISEPFEEEIVEDIIEEEPEIKPVESVTAEPGSLAQVTQPASTTTNKSAENKDTKTDEYSDDFGAGDTDENASNPPDGGVVFDDDDGMSFGESDDDKF